MDINAVRIDQLEYETLDDRNIRLQVLRLDLVHEQVSGNKWFKLTENGRAAVKNHHTTVLTFGGAYSNHLHATAYYCKAEHLQSIAIVRGGELNEGSNATLRECAAAGMELYFVSREEYALGESGATAAALIRSLDPFVIPEGGNNALGALGCERIVQWVPEDVTHLAVSVGTGTTLAGIANGMPRPVALLGFVPMKGGRNMRGRVAQLVKGDKPFLLTDEYHFGGFGKVTEALLQFMTGFEDRYRIPLDRVYTAKMMYGLLDKINSDAFPVGSRIVAIHTGGLQGNR